MKHDSTAKRLKSRLWTFNLFVIFSRQTYFNMYDSSDNNHNIFLVQAFPNCLNWAVSFRFKFY